MNKPANKPLYKDPSFWIVAIVIGVAVNAVQINYGWPWFTQRVAQMKTAPRTPPNQPGNPSRDEINLDTRKKTYSWQVPRFRSEVLEGTPPQVVLIPTEYQPPSGGWGSHGPDRAMGIRMAAEYVLQSAYDWSSRPRMVLNDPLPSGQFDFFAKQPTGALEALQAEIKKQWGLVAEREMRNTNVLVLKLNHRDAPGLKPGGTVPRDQNQPDRFQIRNVPISFLASSLENWSQLPVVDQTGLAERFDIQVPVTLMNDIRVSSNQWEKVRTLCLEQFGLDLIQTNATIEMLVVKKSR